MPTKHFIYMQGMNQLFRYYAVFIWIFVDSSTPLKMHENFLEINFLLNS